MSSSYIKFGENGFWQGDVGTLISLAFILSEMNRRQFLRPELENLKNIFKLELSRGGSGIMDLQFDENLSLNTDARLEFIDICQSVIKTLASHGETIPNQFLEMIIPIEAGLDISGPPCSTKVLVEDISKLEGLVAAAGCKTWKEADKTKGQDVYKKA